MIDLPTRFFKKKKNPPHTVSKLPAPDLHQVDDEPSSEKEATGQNGRPRNHRPKKQNTKYFGGPWAN
jgi:hypothetical protein